MNHYIKRLINNLSEYESKTGLNVSVLDLLWETYLQSNPIDDGLIQKRENDLRAVFQELSVAASDSLSDLIIDLCTAYQRAALLEGVHIGFRLSEELKHTKEKGELQ